jgi:hypothetical protein
VQGVPDTYHCVALPDVCVPSGADCACFRAGACPCVEGAEGGFTLTCPGG